ncbi:FAD-dependent oxidoreductase, partial [Actinospica sp. MGRD01-02]
AGVQTTPSGHIIVDRVSRTTASNVYAAGDCTGLLALASVAAMQGTIVKVAVEEGRAVEAGELVVVLEAMKMEQPITAHKSGTVVGLSAEVGATVSSGAVLCEIKD